jgi:hypothetical protein
MSILRGARSITCLCSLLPHVVVSCVCGAPVHRSIAEGIRVEGGPACEYKGWYDYQENILTVWYHFFISNQSKSLLGRKPTNSTLRIKEHPEKQYSTLA